MPEGDTLHRFAAAMRPWMEHKPLTHAIMAGSTEPELSQREIVRVWAHGKHLLIALAPRARHDDADTGWVVRVHLGMHGTWHRYAVGERWKRARRRAAVVLRVEAQDIVCFDALDVDIARPEGLSQQMPFAHVGPDLLAPTVDFDLMLKRARYLAPKASLADLLLDQRVAAGIGNVYKSEIMFHYGLHPDLASAALSDAQLLDMLQTARTWLQQNLHTPRRTTTYDPRDPPRGALPPRLAVYSRKGEPCLRCGTLITRCVSGRQQRSTYMCPKCQPPPPAPGNGSQSEPARENSTDDGNIVPSIPVVRP